MPRRSRSNEPSADWGGSRSHGLKPRSHPGLTQAFLAPARGWVWWAHTCRSHQPKPARRRQTRRWHRPALGPRLRPPRSTPAPRSLPKPAPHRRPTGYVLLMVRTNFLLPPALRHPVPPIDDPDQHIPSNRTSTPVMGIKCHCVANETTYSLPRTGIGLQLLGKLCS